MFEDEDEPVDYERNRQLLPGLLGSGRTRERVLAAVAGIALIYAGASRWQSSSQLATCKAEKQAGWVVVLDPQGDRIGVPAVSAAEWRLADGMVIERLARTVRCMRGLDPLPKVVVECWKEAAPLFYGVESVAQFNNFNKEKFKNVDAILAQEAKETVTVVVQSYSKPEPSAPNRFWLRWVETHCPRSNGLCVSQTWSGTFDVELVPVDAKERSSGMRIVRWGWRQDLVGVKGAG